MLDINISDLKVDHYVLSFWCGDCLCYLGGKFYTKQAAERFLEKIDFKFCNDILIEPVYKIDKLVNYPGRMTWL